MNQLPLNAQCATHPIELLIDTLTSYIEEKNLSESELARLANVPQPTLHKILAGKTTDPRYSTLKSLADYFEINIDQLFSGGFNTAETHVKQKSIQTIPVISWSDCLNGKKFIGKLTRESWENWLVTEYLSNYAYGLVSKPSMEARFPKGSMLIVNPETVPADGDLVVVHYANTSEATIRELSIDGPDRWLLSINPNAKQDKLSSKINLLGTVIQSRFSYNKA